MIERDKLNDLLSAATVSSHGTTITIECNDFATMSALLELITGDAFNPKEYPTKEK